VSLLTLPAVALLAIAVACGNDGGRSEESFPETPYTTVNGAKVAVELRTAPEQPPSRGVASMQLRVSDRAAAPVDGLALDVVAWMPAHGHGSNVKPKITAEGEGTYRLDDVVFTMPGAWELIVDVHGNALEDHATLRLEVR
jgi:hypothetical protein